MIKTTLTLVYCETGHNLYTYTDRTVALSVVTGLLASGERAYFCMVSNHDNTFSTTAPADMVTAIETAVLAYADMAGARLVSR